MIHFIKVAIAKLIANNFTGDIISLFFQNNIPFYGAKVNVGSKEISGRTKALIFWKLYEDAEINFAKKYLNSDDNIIELGSSIGVVASVISKIQLSGKLICVEANSALIPTITKNLNANRSQEAIIINKAIAYHTDTVFFGTSSDNLIGAISDQANKQGITVGTTTITEILKANNLETFSLMCDIEGAEVSILIEENEVLERCNKIIIELHEVVYKQTSYLVEDLVELIVQNNFKVMDHHGPVYVFQNNNFVV
jgi:FkbM family methyltransferase